MKKFLSMVLALVMTMSLVTVSAGAKDFTDSDEVTYTEAVDVMSAMGIIDGYTDGSFQPTGTLTRGAAAKIIACMMLGKTAAEKLGVTSAPFKDVPVTNTFAGYIAYCVESGLVDGYGDGTFRPSAKLTGFAFLKMLLTALGYNSENEGYTGTNWTVNVASRAIEIGLTDGNDDFVGTELATREEACLYAVNTLKSTLVKYESKESSPVYVTSNVYSAATSIDATRDNATGDFTVEFAEKYQPKLALTSTVDAFGRPAHTWSWDKKEICTAVDADKLVLSETVAVKGDEAYTAIGSVALKEYGLNVWVDGVQYSTSQAETYGDDIYRKSNKTLGKTGNGALTEIYVDNANEEITIAVINTYLGKVNSYTTKDEELSVTVYTGVDTSKPSTLSKTYRVTLEDVAGIDAFEKDDMVRVTMANGQIQSVDAAESVSDVYISAYTTGAATTENDTSKKLKTVTADGTKYSTSVTSYNDAEVLYDYSAERLDGYTYDLYFDAYGYILGIEEHTAATNYVFVVGYEPGSAVLAQAIDKALVILPDGEMKIVEAKDNKLSEADDFDSDQVAVNAWYSYSMDGDTYVLEKKVETQLRVDDATEINSENTTLATGKTPAYVYGNNESVYITVKADTTVAGNGSIVKVNGVSTGIKNTNIKVDSVDAMSNFADDAEVFAMYNDKGYVTYAVVVGTNAAVSKNFVFLTSGITGSYYDSDIKDYVYTYDAIIDGKFVEDVKSLVSKDGVNESGAYLAANKLYEAQYDNDGFIVEMTASTETGDGDQNTADYKNSGYLLLEESSATALTLSGAMLYLDPDDNDHYIILDDSCNFFVSSEGDDYVEYTDAEVALSALGQGHQYDGVLAAVVDTKTGFATTIIIQDKTYEDYGTTPTPPAGNNPIGTVVNPGINTVTVNLLAADYNETNVKTNAAAALKAAGYEVTKWTGGSFSGNTDSTLKATVKNVSSGTEGIEFTINSAKYYTLKIDGVIVEYVKGGESGSVTADSSDYKVGTGYIKSTNGGSTWSYDAYSGSALLTSAANNLEIRTGYVKVVTSGSITATYKLTTSDDTTGVTDTTATYVQAGGRVTLTNTDGSTSLYYAVDAPSVVKTELAANGVITFTATNGNMTITLTNS